MSREGLTSGLAVPGSAALLLWPAILDGYLLGLWPSAFQFELERANGTNCTSRSC
jgi:hypothetical protein